MRKSAQGKGTGDIRSRPGLTNQFHEGFLPEEGEKAIAKMSRSAHVTAHGTGIIRPRLSSHGSLWTDKIERPVREIPCGGDWTPYLMVTRLDFSSVLDLSRPGERPERVESVARTSGEDLELGNDSLLITSNPGNGHEN